MRQNITIDEILDSLKRMVDNKSSRISKYLAEQNLENDYEQYLEKNKDEEESEVLELTEEAIVFDGGPNYSGDKKDEKEIIHSDAEIKIDTETTNHKLSEKTSSETSMYLKYLSDKSSTIKNSKEKTINEFIKEAAMPYVIEWLDKNLNKLVKEIVEKEIKRITSDDK